MASAELKEIRKAMTKESIREHQLSKVGGTETDMFTCGKCKGKNCTYTQVNWPPVTPHHHHRLHHLHYSHSAMNFWPTWPGLHYTIPNK